MDSSSGEHVCTKCQGNLFNRDISFRTTNVNLMVLAHIYYCKSIWTADVELSMFFLCFHPQRIISSDSGAAQVYLHTFNSHCFEFGRGKKVYYVITSENTKHGNNSIIFALLIFHLTVCVNSPLQRFIFKGFRLYLCSQ